MTGDGKENAGPPVRPDGLSPQAPAAVTPRREWLRRLAAARRLWRAETVFVAALAAFAVLAFFARAYAYFEWDRATARALQSLDLPGVHGLMYAASRLGDGWRPWALSGAALLGFYLLRRRTEMFALLLSVGGGTVINRLMKWLIARPRPTVELVNVQREWRHESFPSGHVAFYVCFFGFLFFAAFALLPKKSLKRRAALTLTALPLLLIGLSRVYLGAHWPSDTLGAYLLSGVWLAFVVHQYRRWKARSTFHAEEAETAGAKPGIKD
ncbi:MAG TPA: phosphatase PAP2 family protein [Pyrinomonadaceae bacterium]|nr:phosphatase PAP2 family protein [Pyrinomonadaceae bacterium]